MEVIVVLLVLLSHVTAETLNYREDWVYNLTVTNGGEWGEWAEPEFCPDGDYAIGYSMKIQDYQLFGDDTALNGIKLLCTGKQTNVTITSGVGHRGEWGPRAMCHQNNEEQLLFIRAFVLQVEERQGKFDDTAANFVKFKCNVKDETSPSEELAVDPGHGRHGDFGNWSQPCPQHTAVCGLQTKIHADQGEDEDTTLNDVKFFCCEEFNLDTEFG